MRTCSPGPAVYNLQKSKESKNIKFAGRTQKPGILEFDERLKQVPGPGNYDIKDVKEAKDITLKSRHDTGRIEVHDQMYETCDSFKNT